MKNINRFVSICFVLLIIEPVMYPIVFSVKDTSLGPYLIDILNFIYTVFFPPVVGFILTGILIFIYNKKYDLLTNKMRAILPIYIIVGVFLDMFYFFLFIGVYFRI